MSMLKKVLNNHNGNSARKMFRFRRKRGKDLSVLSPASKIAALNIFVAYGALFFFFFSFFFHPIYYLRPSLSLLVVTQIRGHIAHSRLFFPPTHYGSCLAFLSRGYFSSFFPRRLASN